ncbi:MAG: hypothetical protein ACRD11_07440 [Terriglobia bacterium]
MALGAVAWGLAPAHVSIAQGCAMCYQDAAAQTAAGIRALQHGILVLLIPSLALFAAVFVLAYRRRNRFNNDQPGVEQEARLEAASRSKG